MKRPSGIVRTIARTLYWSILKPLPVDLQETIHAYVRLGYKPNIDKPRSFNEKVIHRKLRQYDPRFAILADKWRVREHIKATIGPGYLTEVYGLVSSPDEIVIDSLPNAFVAKPTHASGQVLFVRDKSQLEQDAFCRRVERWLRHAYRHGQLCHEYWYEQMPRRVLFEELLMDDRYGVPLDFKFYVFHGRVEAVQVDFNRFSAPRRNFYDRQWRLLPFTKTYPQNTDAFGPPATLPEMIETAETLGRDFDFVRVDLFSVNDTRVVFGELTFAPGSGCSPFTPRSFDFKFGELW